MLADNELELRFADLESDMVEGKRNAENADRIRQAICAFANDMPNHAKSGLIFVGQEDDGRCSGIGVDDTLLKTLSNLRDDGKIQPFPVMSVAPKVLNGCSVAVIEVQPSDNPPVRVDGRVWIRVGPRRAQATGEEERRLLEKRRWGNLPYDAQGVVGASMRDLDLARFEIELLPSLVPPDILESNDRPQKQQLRALRLLNDADMPTITGMLLLAKSLQTWIPGAYVQFLRIEGNELTDPILDNHIISGTLLDQMHRIDELLAINIRTRTRVGESVRDERPDYPLEALRQLCRNALIHRTYEGTHAPVRVTWYSDRIEIQSPGGPYGQVTIENFGHGVTDYRNPTIAGLMVQLKYMERFGVGIAIARKALQQNGNPEMKLEPHDQHVLAIVWCQQ